MNTRKRAVLDRGGWTPFPNWIVQNFDRFHPVQYKILSLVIFSTIGSQKPNNRFSVRYISDRTGLNKTTVHKHLRALLAAGWLIDSGRGEHGEFLLEIPAESPFTRAKSQDAHTEHEATNQDTTDQNIGQTPSWFPGQNKEDPDNNTNKEFWDTISGIMGNRTVSYLRHVVLSKHELIFPSNLDSSHLNMLRTMGMHGFQIRFSESPGNALSCSA